MNKSHLLIGFMCSLLMTAVAVSAPAVQAGILEKLFAPKAKLWAHWTQHDPDSTRTIDHTRWDSFLTAYAVEGDDGVNRVAYSRVCAADHGSLKSYIREMQALRVSEYSRGEQFAYWVNLYNALTVDIVLDHYPIESVRDIKLTKGLFTKGPWSKKLLVIEDNKVSLNDIEHRILRPIWRDPRIHYAVNCAAMGCPNLMLEPFTADNATRLLEAGARGYVNHQRGVRLYNGRLYVSSIYVWFESDFGGTEASVVDHLRRYAEPELDEKLKDIRRISDDSYDWSLNDAER